MIGVVIDTVKYPDDDELYILDDVVHFNPDLVCALKPAVVDKGKIDIMTADGMMYRTHDTSALERFKRYGATNL